MTRRIRIGSLVVLLVLLMTMMPVDVMAGHMEKFYSPERNLYDRLVLVIDNRTQGSEAQHIGITVIMGRKGVETGRFWIIAYADQTTVLPMYGLCSFCDGLDVLAVENTHPEQSDNWTARVWWLTKCDQ